MRVNFLRWAKKNLQPDEIARIKRVDETYRKTARGAGVNESEGSGRA